MTRGEPVSHKVQAPTLIRSGGRRPLHPLSADALLRSLEPQRQTFKFIEPIDSLMVHHPALSAQQDVQPQIAIADSCGGQLSQPQPQRLLVCSTMSVEVSREVKPQRTTCAPDTDTKGGHQKICQPANLHRP